MVAKERELFGKLEKIKQPPIDNSPASADSESLQPRDVVDLVARRHGVTRKEAQEMLDDHGV